MVNDFLGSLSTSSFFDDEGKLATEHDSIFRKIDEYPKEVTLVVGCEEGLPQATQSHRVAMLHTMRHCDKGVMAMEAKRATEARSSVYSDGEAMIPAREAMVKVPKRWKAMKGISRIFPLLQNLFPRV